MRLNELKIMYVYGVAINVEYLHLLNIWLLLPVVQISLIMNVAKVLSSLGQLIILQLSV